MDGQYLLQRLDLTDFFLAAASKEPPTLVVLLRARFRAPLPLPPEWRDTHASQQTNSQLLCNQKIRLASPNLWWVRCIGWRERVCTKLIEAGMPAAASSLLQLTKLAPREFCKSAPRDLCTSSTRPPRAAVHQSTKAPKHQSTKAAPKALLASRSHQRGQTSW